MFVQRNNVKAVKAYFNDRLKNNFSTSEIKLMVRDCVCSRLGLSFSDYLLSDEQLLSESDLLYFRSVIKRLLDGEPFQYIYGSVLFCGVELKTDQRALIPRPETEELVDWICSTCGNDFSGNVLDLCAGTGCISFALERQMADSSICAVEYSSDAYALLIENKSLLSSTIETMQADILQSSFWDRIAEDSTDLIISNPPYIARNEKDSIGKNVLNYEPHLALFVSDEDPLIFYRIILQKGIHKLRSKGRFFFEINPLYADAIFSITSEMNLFNIALRKDLQGKHRMLMVQKP